MVHDQLGRVTARSLNKFDRVKIEGKLSYMPYKNASGKKQNCGFIVAQSIERVDWFWYGLKYCDWTESRILAILKQITLVRGRFWSAQPFQWNNVVNK